jgi:hypothetical protein
MSARRHLLLWFGSLVSAIVIANVVGDTLHLARFDGLRGAVVALATAAILGAGTGFAGARSRRTPHVTRAVAVAAICASTTAFLLLRFPSPWVDLGPFGAGPWTALALVVFPITQALATFTVYAWSDA